MIKNLLKTTFRGYLRNKTFTSLNFISLVIGLFVAFVCFSFIKYETEFEGFHEKKDDTFRLVRKYRSQDYSVIGFPNYSNGDGSDQLNFIKSLNNVGTVKRASQFIISPYSEYLTIGEKQVNENGILTTNTPEAFAKTFTWNLIAGSLQDFESGFGKIVLTESTALKLTNNKPKELIGESIEVAGSALTIVAVIADLSEQSHFDFNIAISSTRIDYWGSRVYIEREPNTDVDLLETDINNAIAAFDPKLKADELYRGHYLQGIGDIHLKSNILYEAKTPGNVNYIYLIAIIGMLILGISLFNYTNLTLALKTKQHKSIGVNKVLGASRSLVVGQILTESALLSILSVPFVALLSYWLIPVFNEIMNVEIQAFSLESLMILFVLAIIIGLISGIAPAQFYLNKKPVNLFKSQFQSESIQKLSLRKYLVVSQLAILICISSVTYFVSEQLDFVATKDVGFKKSGILYTSSNPETIDVFQQQLRQIPEISNVGNGSSFGTNPTNQLTYKLEGDDTVFDDANQLYLDYNALEIYDLKVSFLTEKKDGLTIINRTAAEKLSKVEGVSERELIGKRIITEPEYVNEETGQVGFPIVIGGIFEDINLYSLHESVKPYFVTLSDKIRMDGSSIVSYDPRKTKSVLSQIQTLYASSSQPFPLEVEFLEDNLSSLYEEDEKVAGLLFSFNLVAIALSVLGIVGISLFLALSKVKEIGIRKVLGATPLSIVQLSTKAYLVWVSIAALIAWPVSYYLTESWLSNFAYRVNITNYVVPFIGICTLLLCTILVGLVVYRISLVNPVKSLKNE